MASKPPSQSPVFVDTAYLVALLNRRDRFHAVAKDLAKAWARDETALATNDAVLIEFANFFSRSPLRPKAIAWIGHIRSDSGWNTIGLSQDLLSRAENRFARHADKYWSLTDCLSMENMLDLDARLAATTDNHFAQAGFEVLMRNG